MQVVFHPGHAAHDPKHFLVSGALQRSPEIPARADTLRRAAESDGHEIVAPADCGLAPIAAVHTPEYLQFLENVYVRWRRIEGSSEEVIPNVHPVARGPAAMEMGYPDSVVGQAGYHMADTACPIGPGTWKAACESASCAVEAARRVVEGASACYALCRPPGHHAFADMAGGFCFLNNTAIGAQWLTAAGRRVAVLDVDVHHGNGTQGVFYRRGDVLTVSLHADPIRFYPFFWGYAAERGAGPGLGANLNLPLARGTGDDEYLLALDRALARIRSFAPDVVVVALGLDAFVGDPLAGLAITTHGFGRIGEAIGRLGLPGVLVQEGGYPSDELGANLVSFLAGFEKGQASST